MCSGRSAEPSVKANVAHGQLIATVDALRASASVLAHTASAQTVLSEDAQWRAGDINGNCTVGSVCIESDE